MSNTNRASKGAGVKTEDEAKTSTTEIATQPTYDLSEIPQVAGFTRLASVSFYGSKTKEPRNSLLKDAGVQKNAFYLGDDAGIINVNPFRFFVTPGFFQHFAKVNGAGQAIQIRMKGKDGKGKDGWRPDKKKRPEDDKWNDATLALVLVPLLDDKGVPQAIVPALLRTYKAVDNVWKTLAATSQMASTPAGWAIRGPSYKVAAEASEWFGRFVMMPGVVEKPIPGDATQTYNDGFAKCVPTDAGLVKMFNLFVGGGGLQQPLESFHRIKDKMIADLRKD